jgi:hypothetical protein
MNNKTILETLKPQPLTEEEKQRRHILGRWYGPIATCSESTRNGRRYNRELWERAINDELFHEKIANKCLFLELGHPQDREETDMSKVCACIPEMPRIIDNDLCACVDILDTPNGKILKTLCDYGFVPGISSRGSGDVMPNNDVDPETFFLECFDIVAIPAVKKARLAMCESLNTEEQKLRKALTESFNEASDEDKAIMKETLDNLNIDLEEPVIEEPMKQALTDADIPWAPDEKVLTEEMPAEDDDTEQSDNSDEPATVEADSDADTAEASDEAVDDDEAQDAPEEPSDEEASEDADSEDAAKGDSDKKTVDITAVDEDELNTVGDAIDLLQEYDNDVKIEVQPVQVDGKEFAVDKFTSFIEDRDEEKVLVLGVDCVESDDTLDDADIDIEAVEEDEPAVETIEAVDEDEAGDAGDDEVIESLKNVIRQKDALETEVDTLRKAKAVGDAKEQELQEELYRCRAALAEARTEAAKVPKLRSRIQALSENLTQSKATIETLTEKVNKAQQLKESIEGSKVNERRLNEEVSRLAKKSEALEAKLEGQTKVYTEKLQERTNLAKSYKARFIETLTKYVESKANMLSISPSEITSRLNENYTLADVDAVCDQILESTVSFSRLPFSGRQRTSARISESVSRSSAYEEDDLSDLYELAGLK